MISIDKHALVGIHAEPLTLAEHQRSRRPRDRFQPISPGVDSDVSRAAPPCRGESMGVEEARGGIEDTLAFLR